MLIEEIDETNFIEKNEEGSKRVELKIKRFERQIERTIYDKKDRKSSVENKDAIDWNVLYDPTIWAYKFLKDEEGNPLQLYGFQDKIINDKNRFIHVTAANQIGKTWALEVKALHHAIHTNNGSVLIISKSEDQAIRILDEIKWMMKRANIPFESIIDEVDNRTELHLTNEDTKGISTVRAFAPTTKVLGFKGTLVLLDETGHWEKQTEMTPTEYYEQVIEPRTNATKNWKHPFFTMGQIVSITNPYGEQGLAYDLYNDERFNNYQYCWLAKSLNTLEEYLYHKNRLAPYRFASIYAATYMSPEGGFISLDQYNKFASYNHNLIIDINKILFLGGDVASSEAKGQHTDWNVLYGVQQIERYEKDSKERLPRLKLVYMKEWPPKTPTTEIYAEIKRLVNSGVTIAKFAYDRVGVADKLKNDLIDRGILSNYQIEVLTYSLPNKSDVYINLQTFFEQGLLEGRDIPKLKEQTLGLKVEQPLGSVHIKVHHKTEGLKDDHPDGLANACYAARILKGIPVEVTFVPHTQQIKTIEKKGNKGDLLFCLKCQDYHWTSEPHRESSLEA